MQTAAVTVLLFVRLGLAVTEPRTAEERLLEMDVERRLGGAALARPGLADSRHKLLRSHHRVRHRPRDFVPQEAEVRCYCNLPACVTTGYMCQSMVGSCFSETVELDGRARANHGCLELLSRHKQHICERLHSQNKSDLRLRCCTEDMCNVADTVGINIQVANTRNSTLRPAVTPPPELLGAGGRQRSHSGELWLRAATIAVPIAGLFILCVLVLLAVRMLRRDSKPQYQYAKAPLCAEPTAPHEPTGSGRLLAPLAGGPRPAVCCVYAADARCPHGSANV